MATNKDWTGNRLSVHQAIGARNYAQHEREHNDFYATEPKAVEMLLKVESFAPNIWECACGRGQMSKVLEANGYKVRSTDLVDRGYGEGGVDFLAQVEQWDGDIITNPPYKYGIEFVDKRLELIKDGNRVAMFLKLQFLEGKKRRAFFEKNPPKIIYVSTSRLVCALGGDFESYKHSNAVTYAWFIWEKGYKGDPIIKWFN